MAQGFGQEVQRQSPRISQLKSKLDGSEDADLIMMSIMEVFREIEYVPDPGNYYTFVYIPKTPEITYDEHPLVAVTEVQRWGFRGFNYHWRMMRNYTWIEVAGALHHIRPNEIDYLRSLPFGKIRTK